MDYTVLKSSSARDASSKTGDEIGIHHSEVGLHHAENDDNEHAALAHEAAAIHHNHLMDRITDPTKRALHQEAFRRNSDAATHHRIRADELRQTEASNRSSSPAEPEQPEEVKSRDNNMNDVHKDRERKAREERYAPYLIKYRQEQEIKARQNTEQIAKNKSTKVADLFDTKAADTTYAGWMKPDSVVENEDDILAPNDLAGKDEPSPGIRALLNTAQFLIDGCDSLEEDMSQSDSPELRAYGQQLMMEMKALAEAATEQAEYVKSKLDGDGEKEEEEEDDDDDKKKEDENEKDEDKEVDEANEDDEEKNKKGKKSFVLNRDDYGFIICKSFPEWRPRRFTRANLKDLDDGRQAELKAQFDEQMKRLAKAKADADALLKAGKR